MKELINIINEEILKLGESPERLDVDGKSVYYSNPNVNSYAFLIYKDMMIASKKNGTHADGVVDAFSLNMNDTDDKNFLNKIVYLNDKEIVKGRIWIDYKVISFWGDYVSQETVNKTKEKLKKYFPSQNFNEYTVDEYNTVK